MEHQLYPFKCKPILKEKLWGGEELRNFLHKSSPYQNTGESWEVANLPEGTSCIDNGIYKGKCLNELIQIFSKDILGSSILEKFGLEMPLLIKFIDASDKLSVQLHPDDVLANKAYAQNGKTEMWYVLKAQKDSHIIAGFNTKMNSRKFETVIENDDLESHLNYLPVNEGDAFYIPAGLIHAIGAGIVLVEIQQPSDITYRVHDYTRRQKDGSFRDLHIKEAMEAIKYETPEDVSIMYDPKMKGSQILKHSPFFKTDFIHLSNGTHIVERNDTFTILIAVKGSGTIKYNEEDFLLKMGDTYLVPAHCKKTSIIASSELKFLEVYL